MESRKISTQELDLLPLGNSLQKLCKSISVLEAIICPDWQYRYYSYQSDWSPNEELCQMRNGQGDSMHILFSAQGVVINGFAHESRMSGWKGILDDLPAGFHEFIYEEPIKSIGTTFCIWQSTQDQHWQIGKIDFPEDSYKDGSMDLMQLLDGNPVTYKEWAEDYYEEEFEDRDLKIEWVEHIYQHKKLRQEIIDGINPDLEDMESLINELAEIGYGYED